MKTLNTIQTLSKIGKALSKIVYIGCIVGFCGCVASMIVMLLGAETLKFGGVTLHSLLEIEAGVGIGTIWSAIAVGGILCIGEFFVSRMAYRYFVNELHDGTPFTLHGAKELLHLGISVIWIPIVSVILAQVVQDVFLQWTDHAEKITPDGFDSMALGVMFIVMSLLCKYGTELQDNRSKGVCYELNN